MTLPLMQPNTSPVWVIQNQGVGGTIAEGIQQFGQNYLAAQQAAAQKEAAAEKARQEQELGAFLQALLTGGADAGVPEAQMGGTQPIPVRDPKAPQADLVADQGPGPTDRLPPDITPTMPGGSAQGGMPDPGAPDAVGMEERFWAGIRRLDPKLIIPAAQAAAPFLNAERQRQAQLALAEQDRILNRFLPAIRSGELSVADALAQTPPHLRDEAAKLYGEAGKGRLEETKATKTPDLIEYDAYVAQETAAGRTPMPVKDWLIRKPTAGATRVSTTVLPGEQAGRSARGKGVGEQDVAARDRALSLVKGAQNTVRQAELAKSVIAGPAADTRLSVARVLGISPDKVTDTEEYTTLVGNLLLDRARALGTGNGFSNTDREFLLGVLGGNLSFSRGGLLQIARMKMQGEMRELREYITEYDALAAEDPEGGFNRFVTPQMRNAYTVLESAFKKIAAADPTFDEDHYGKGGHGRGAKDGVFGDYEGLKPVP